MTTGNTQWRWFAASDCANPVDADHRQSDRDRLLFTEKQPGVPVSAGWARERSAAHDQCDAPSKAFGRVDHVAFEI